MLLLQRKTSSKTYLLRNRNSLKGTGRLSNNEMLRNAKPCKLRAKCVNSWQIGCERWLQTEVLIERPIAV